MQKQSDEQASLSIESRKSRTLGTPEEGTETSWISPDSNAVSTLLICDNICVHGSQSPDKEPQPENIRIKARTFGDPRGQEATSYGTEYAGNKAGCMERFRHRTLEAEDQSAATGGRDNSGATNSGLKRPPPGQNCCVCCHPQANIGGLEQFASVLRSHQSVSQTAR